MDKKIIKKILEDFKESLFISLSIEKFKVKPFDFFDALKQDEELNNEYKKIENYNNLYKEEQVAEKVFNQGLSKTIMLEMIKANNKKKYTNKIIIEDENSILNLTDDELDEKIKLLQEQIKKT